MNTTDAMERVTTKQAASELNMDLETLQYLMRQERLPIDMQSRGKAQREERTSYIADCWTSTRRRCEEANNEQKNEEETPEDHLDSMGIFETGSSRDVRHGSRCRMLSPVSRTTQAPSRAEMGAGDKSGNTADASEGKHGSSGADRIHHDTG